MPNKILVIGGGGYIGCVLVPALLADGHEVTVLDNFAYRQNGLLDVCHNPKLNIVRGDCRDRAVLEGVLPGADFVFPLAALVGAPLCDADRIAATTINLDSIRTLLELRGPSQRIIFPCTNSGYGIGDKNAECTEESPLRPISLYGTTKVEAERAILEAGNSLSLRLATVFGASPRMRIDLLVNDFVFRAVSDQAVLIFEGHFKRNYIHIRDVARAFVHAMANFDSMRGGPFNVGLSDANISKLELCAKIKEHLPKFVYVEAAIGQDPDKRDYIVSNAKIEKTGYRPAFSLDDGIRELINVYKIIRPKQYANV